MRLVRVNNVVIVILLLSIVHHVQCRNNDLNESKSEKRRNPGRLRASKSSARIVEKTINVYNVTDANNNTLSVINSVAQIDIEDVKSKKIRANKKGKTHLICPQEKQAPFQLIPTLCRRNRDCRKTGNNSRCCNLFGSKRCVQGVPMPIPEPPHDPIFGIPRRCPDQPLTETFWDIKTCQTDNDCWPRVCCPDGDKKYCRTSQPIFEESENPAARQLAYPIEAVSQYLQCTPPPPVIFDIHPKSCNSTLDCFPNLCCQESGKRHCRPPKRSLLAFVTGLTSGKSSGSDSYIVVPIHHHEKLLDQCVQLINSEWPRSYTARLWSLKSSKDTLPTSMILIDNINNKESNVLAHAKLSPIPSDAEAVFIETVVVDRRFRGKGLGKFLMVEVENHCFETLKLKTIYLSTIDQEGFYLKLGYNFCKAMNMFGTRSSVNTSTKKIWMMKKYSEWKRLQVHYSDNDQTN